MAEYQKAKAEREAAYEAEQEKIRIEKEREISRLRSLQERAKDEQAERDALRAKRAQESVSTKGSYDVHRASIASVNQCLLLTIEWVWKPISLHSTHVNA